MANEEKMDISEMLKDHQVVLVATDPHLEDLVVGGPEEAEMSDDVLPAKIIQMPIKVVEDERVETKMAALIMVEPEDLPPDAQNIIKEELEEFKADQAEGRTSEPQPVLPITVTTQSMVVLPPFEPYYYLGKLPNNFASSLTTNVSTNAYSMVKMSVDSTKLTDMLTMARLSTQLSSINDSIHTFIATSEGANMQHRARGDSSLGIYSSSPCRTTDMSTVRQNSTESKPSDSEKYSLGHKDQQSICRDVRDDITCQNSICEKSSRDDLYSNTFMFEDLETQHGAISIDKDAEENASSLITKCTDLAKPAINNWVSPCSQQETSVSCEQQSKHIFSHEDNATRYVTVPHSGNACGATEYDLVKMSTPTNSPPCDKNMLDEVIASSLSSNIKGDHKSDVMVDDMECVTIAPESTEAFRSPSINDLPREVLLKLFAYVTHTELLKTVALVCRYWRDLAYDPIHWQYLSTRIIRSDQISYEALADVVRRMPLLKSLRLCDLQGSLCDMITLVSKSCPMLTDLELSFCDKLNLTVVKCLCDNLPGLESLNMEGSRHIDGECVIQIAELRDLISLNLSHCTLATTHSICVLAKSLRRLHRINIDGISQIKDEAVMCLASHQSNSLVWVDLDGAELTDAAILALLRCNYLSRLSISFAELLTDKSLMYIKEMHWLVHLQIKKGLNFTNEALYWLFSCKTLDHLTSLNLSECSQLGDNTIIAVSECCGKTLTALNLCWCWNITDVGIEAVVDNCSQMKILDLLGLEKIEGHSLSRIPVMMPNLQYLNLQHCNIIIDNVIEEIVRQMPGLVAINYYGEEFHSGLYLGL